MENMIFEEISSEKCPVCGEFYRYRFVAGQIRQPQKFCSCENAKILEDRAKDIARGKENIRTDMRNASGMKSIQRAARIESFIPREGQHDAYKAAHNFIQLYSADRHTTGLMFSGGVGSGKTLLAAAIANAVIDQYPISDSAAMSAAEGSMHRTCVPVRFISTVDLFTQLTPSYNKNASFVDILEDLKNVPLLILDDLGAERAGDWAMAQMFNIIDHRNAERLPVIITSNKEPSDLKAFGDRLYDRLRAMCAVVSVTAESQRETAAISN